MRVCRWVIGVLAVNLLVASAIVLVDETRAAGEVPGQEVGADPSTIYHVYETMVLAASVAFVTAISVVGAAYAVGKIGSAAIGAAAEKPELLVRSLAIVGLAEGLALAGFVIAIMLWSKM